jgi:predicted nucleic acid-binding protein
LGLTSGLVTGLRLADRPMLVPGTVIAEVGYLLDREAGPRAESLLLRSLAAGDFDSVDLTTDDLARIADLVEHYSDLPLGTTDAAVISLAERLNITDDATLDRRHFAVVRPVRTAALTLLP